MQAVLSDMKSIEIFKERDFSQDILINEKESKYKEWLKNGYDDWLDVVNNPYPLTIDDILREGKHRRKSTDVNLRLLRWRFYKCNYCGKQIWLSEEFVKKPNPKEDPNYLLLCNNCYVGKKKLPKKGIVSSWKWKTPREKRLNRRVGGGLRHVNKILNKLRKSEELSTNLTKRLSCPSKQLLLNLNKEEVESLCKVDGYYCNHAVTYTQKMLTDEFRDRFKRLHETGWIHSRKMQDAALVVLHSLLVKKLYEKIGKTLELPKNEIWSNEISNRLIRTLLGPALVGAVIDAIEEKYPERMKILYERDLPYFLGREAQEIKEELLKKHPGLQIELIPYFTRRIDPALFNVRKGDLWQLFRMPYWKGEKPVEMLKRVEKEVRIQAWMRFRNFLSDLSADQLKQCKKTGLNAACCYLETYLYEYNALDALLPLSGSILRKGYKPKMLVLPVSQEKWAKAFGITRQTLINRIKELEKHYPMTIKYNKFVKYRHA